MKATIYKTIDPTDMGDQFDIIDNVNEEILDTFYSMGDAVNYALTVCGYSPDEIELDSDTNIMFTDAEEGELYKGYTELKKGQEHPADAPTVKYDKVADFKRDFVDKVCTGMGFDVEYTALTEEEKKAAEERAEKMYETEMKITWNGMEINLYFGAPLYNEFLAFCDGLIEEDYD